MARLCPPESTRGIGGSTFERSWGAIRPGARVVIIAAQARVAFRRITP